MQGDKAVSTGVRTLLSYSEYVKEVIRQPENSSFSKAMTRPTVGKKPSRKAVGRQT